MFRLFRRDREKGAALVEFALILPLFLLLVFGIMEAGWFFAQQVEIRHASREGARLAVVDYGTAGAVISETCDRANISGTGATVTITLSADDVYGLGADSVSVTVDKVYTSLTGFVDFFDGNMSSTAEMRTERPLDTLGNGTGPCS
jgi:Flp pilus assembly protein TadG